MNEYQYPPPPYSPPIVNPSAWAYAAPLAESRSASIWQLILGCLIFLFGTCVSVLLFVPDSMLQTIVDQQHLNLQPVDHLSLIQEFRLGVAFATGSMLIAGGLLLVLTIFVRKGGKASSIVSIIVICLIALFMALGLPNELLQVAANPMAILSLLLSLGVLALCITTIAKLTIAMKSAGSAQSTAQQQAYYWMMQQQAGAQAQAGYNQAGYNQSGNAPAGYGPVGYYQGGYPPPPNPPQNPPETPAPPQNSPAPDQPPMPSDREK